MHATVAHDADVAVLRELNRDYVRAVQESDVAWFEKNLADDFLNSNPDCSFVDRAGFLMQIAKPAGIARLQEQDVRIRLFGDVAIIHAKTSYAKADGRPGVGRYTDVWTRRQDRWLCVAAHVNRG
jgi:ketosteroid isomerase-like protein